MKLDSTALVKFNLSLDIETLSETHTKHYLLHITWEFYSIKLICTNLYALFSHVEKAYTANQNGVQLFHMWKYNQSTIA